MEFLETLYELSTLKDVKLLSDPGNQMVQYQETDHRMKDIFEFMAENYSKKITVDDMQS